MLLIMDRAEAWEEESEADIAGLMEAHMAFMAYLDGRGGEYSSEALQPPATATSLRPSPDGAGVVITDGPFIELKEHLGGYYVIEASDLDDAIEVAKRCPAAYGIEVRPVMEFS
jgi:hypothetical protein